MSEDLKEEYSQYVNPQTSLNTSELMKASASEKKRGYFTIESIFKVNGSISQHFEPFMSPYVQKERDTLLEKVLQSLNQDLQDPKENCTVTENLRILNSSLHFVNSIKHLVRRASSISTGTTLINIFAVI